MLGILSTIFDYQGQEMRIPRAVLLLQTLCSHIRKIYRPGALCVYPLLSLPIVRCKRRSYDASKFALVQHMGLLLRWLLWHRKSLCYATNFVSALGVVRAYLYLMNPCNYTLVQEVRVLTGRSNSSPSIIDTCPRSWAAGYPPLSVPRA